MERSPTRGFLTHRRTAQSTGAHSACSLIASGCEDRERCESHRSRLRDARERLVGEEGPGRGTGRRAEREEREASVASSSSPGWAMASRRRPPHPAGDVATRSRSYARAHARNALRNHVRAPPPHPDVRRRPLRTDVRALLPCAHDRACPCTGSSCPDRAIGSLASACPKDPLLAISCCRAPARAAVPRPFDVLASPQSRTGPQARPQQPPRSQRRRCQRRARSSVSFRHAEKATCWVPGDHRARPARPHRASADPRATRSTWCASARAEGTVTRSRPSSTAPPTRLGA